MRDELKEFAQFQEIRLSSKDDEKDHWDCTSISYLFCRLKEQVEALEEALEECDPDEVFKQCIDTANFSMMIGNKLLKRRSIMLEIFEKEQTTSLCNCEKDSNGTRKCGVHG